MPGSNRVAYGNELYDVIIAPTTLAGAAPGTLAWSTATIATVTTAELTTTIPGLQLGDVADLYLNSGAMPTGLSITNVRVSALNTLAVTFSNSSGGTVTIPTTSWLANISRPEGGVSALPTTML